MVRRSSSALAASRTWNWTVAPTRAWPAMAMAQHAELNRQVGDVDQRIANGHALQIEQRNALAIEADLVDVEVVVECDRLAGVEDTKLHGQFVPQLGKSATQLGASLREVIDGVLDLPLKPRRRDLGQAGHFRRVEGADHVNHVGHDVSRWPFL